MKKSEEIAKLQSLKNSESTYFGEFFSNSDIDKMCQNIENDYPIELGVPRLEASKQAQQYAERMAKYEDELNRETALVEGLLRIFSEEAQSDATWRKIADLVGTLRLITFKLDEGMELAPEESKIAAEFIKNNINK